MSRPAVSRFVVALGWTSALVLSACTGGSDTKVSAAETTSSVAEIVAGAQERTDTTASSNASSGEVAADGDDVAPVTATSDGTATPGRAAPAAPTATDGGQAVAAPAAKDDQPDLGRPDEVVEQIKDALDGQPVSGAEVLDAIEPLDEKPTASEIQQVRGSRDGTGDPTDNAPRNEAGELAQLDESAALACADVERALTAIDEGSVETAVEEIESAATRAGESSIEDIAAWSEVLSGSWTGGGDDPAVLLGFLSSCTKGGYEL